MYENVYKKRATQRTTERKTQWWLCSYHSSEAERERKQRKENVTERKEKTNQEALKASKEIDTYELGSGALI